MKKLLISGTAVIALVLGVARRANAGLLDIVGGVQFDTPPDGGDGITGNQVFAPTSGYVGAGLQATQNVNLTYAFIGFEAGFTDHFLVDGTLAFVNQSTAVGTAVNGSALAGQFLDFDFIADVLNQSGLGPINIPNAVTNVNAAADYFLGVVGAGIIGGGVPITGDSIHIALDDSGGGPNDNPGGSDANLHIAFYGADADFVNQFSLAGTPLFSHPGGTIIAASLGSPLGTFDTTVSGGSGFLAFSFETDLAPGGTPDSVDNASNPNDAGGAVDGPNFLLSFDPQRAGTETECDTVYVFLDDGGAGPDDNHDDFLVAITVSVPEPASMALLGTGMLGIGLLACRRRR